MCAGLYTEIVRESPLMTLIPGGLVAMQRCPSSRHCAARAQREIDSSQRHKSAISARQTLTGRVCVHASVHAYAICVYSVYRFRPHAQCRPTYNIYT